MWFGHYHHIFFNLWTLSFLPSQMHWVGTLWMQLILQFYSNLFMKLCSWLMVLRYACNLDNIVTLFFISMWTNFSFPSCGYFLNVTPLTNLIQSFWWFARALLLVKRCVSAQDIITTFFQLAYFVIFRHIKGNEWVLCECNSSYSFLLIFSMETMHFHIAHTKMFWGELRFAFRQSA